MVAVARNTTRRVSLHGADVLRSVFPSELNGDTVNDGPGNTGSLRLSLRKRQSLHLVAMRNEMIAVAFARVRIQSITLISKRVARTLVSR